MPTPSSFISVVASKIRRLRTADYGRVSWI
jgi:hypothetical protein